MRKLLSVWLLFLTGSVLQAQEKSRHDQWSFRKADEVHLWPGEVSFLHETNENGQRYITARLGLVNDQWYYLYDLEKSGIYKLTYGALERVFDVAPQLHSHYDEMPVIERSLNDQVIRRMPELWPEKVTVQIDGSLTKWRFEQNTYEGLQNDLLAGTHALPMLKTGDSFEVKSFSNGILRGTGINKKGKIKGDTYYALYTDFYDQVKINFRKFWETQLANFGGGPSYDQIFDPSNCNFFQYIIPNPETGLIDIYSFAYDEWDRQFINVRPDVSYEMLDFLYPEPFKVEPKRDDTAFFYPILESNFFFAHYTMPVPQDWYTSDSTFTINRKVKNWITPPRPLSMDPPKVHDTEKWVLFQIPEHWEIASASSSSALFYGNTDHYITMYNGFNKDTLNANIELVIKSKPQQQKPNQVQPTPPTDPVDELETEQVFVLENVRFKARTTIMVLAGGKDLRKLATYLKAHKDLSVELRGHTDSNGNLKANMKLSQSKVEFVIGELKKYGVNKKRMTGKGYGPTVPIADNETEEGRQKNRRVEFILHE